MCQLVIPSEGISVKEHGGAEETYQLCAQMGMAHMRMDGGIGGWGSLRAPLNLAVIDPVNIPYIDMQGCHHSRHVNLRDWGTFGGTSASWAVRHETIAVGTCLCLLGGGGLTEVERSGWVRAHWRMSYRPFPLIWPLKTPLVGGHWSSGIPPPTTGHWLDAIGTASEKKQEDQIAWMWSRARAEG